MTDRPPTHGIAPKLALLVITTLICSGVGYLVYSRWLARNRGTTVDVVDNTQELVDALTGRSRVGELPILPESNGSFPPPLLREPLDEKTAKVFFSFVGRGKFDPWRFYTQDLSIDKSFDFPEHPEGKFRIRTNSLGMREAEEVRADVPALRVLVTGDSHTDGVCGNEENFTSLLEDDLRKSGADAEVLNCATFGYSFYQYLATLEHYLYLKPNVFIVAVYGGNDFYGMLSLQRYFHRRPPPKTSNPSVFERIKAIDPERASGIAAQELTQAAYFVDNPEDVAVAVATAASISKEIARLCAENSITPIFVYLPPAYRAQPHFTKDDLARFLPALGLPEDALSTSDRIADRWLTYSKELGIEVLDLRSAMRDAEMRTYWIADHHLNLVGHRLVADELAKLVPRP